MSAMVQAKKKAPAATAPSFTPVQSSLRGQHPGFAPMHIDVTQIKPLASQLPLLQPKLTIAAVNDPYEREADRVAETVMRMPEPNACHQPGCAQTLQRQATNTATTGEVSSSVHEALRSPGQPLDAETRAFMEPRFGHDFSQVRVHADTKAAESAQSVNALAYTVGRDVVFQSGAYSPSTYAGRQLVAHELTHVVQQGRVLPSFVQCESVKDQSAASAVTKLKTPAQLQRLGVNPTCTQVEANDIHQAIFDARGWLNKAIPKLEKAPLSLDVRASLRRNFGPTYGVAANAKLIRDRLATARAALGRISVGCDTAGVSALCIQQHCGWATPGSNRAAICTNPPSTLDLAWPQAPACVLHESLHASMSFMTVDRYKGVAGYPGVGTEPLKNADSYTHLAMDLS